MIVGKSPEVVAVALLVLFAVGKSTSEELLDGSSDVVREAVALLKIPTIGTADKDVTLEGALL